MKLFIRDKPFSVEGDPSAPCVDIQLRMAITEPDEAEIPPTPSSPAFVLDTGADYATVFPSNLEDLGISPDEGPSGGRVPFILADGTMIFCPMRDVSLWLYSNIPGLEDQPYRIELNGGVVVLPSPDPDVASDVVPLFGMNPLLDAKLRIEIDAQKKCFSVWVPD